jgi:hypothetical protein
MQSARREDYNINHHGRNEQRQQPPKSRHGVQLLYRNRAPTETALTYAKMPRLDPMSNIAVGAKRIECFFLQSWTVF